MQETIAQNESIDPCKSIFDQDEKTFYPCLKVT